VLEAALARLHRNAGDQRAALLWALARGGDRTGVAKIRDIVATTADPLAFEWGVDALLDLGVDEGEVLRAFPDQRWVLDRLIVLLERNREAVMRAAPAKIDSLKRGDLRLALELVLRPGWKPTRGTPVRDYLDCCAEYGGKYRRYLAPPTLSRVRGSIADPEGDTGTRTAALLALRLVPGAAGDKVEIATGMLAEVSRGTVHQREAAVSVLVDTGSREAIALLAAHVERETDVVIRAAALRAIARRPIAFDVLKRIPAGDRIGRAILLDGIAAMRGDPRAATVLDAAFEGGSVEAARIAAFHRARDPRTRDGRGIERLLAEARGDDYGAHLAAECLLSLRETKVIGVWVAALRSPDPVRRAIAAGRLAVRTGHAFGADAAAWEAWWKANAKTFAFEEVDHETPRRDRSGLFELEEE
jgi:hypothetical protein